MNSQAPTPARIPLSAHLILGAVLFCLVPMLLGFFGLPFLPTANWIDRAKGASVVCGIVLSAMFLMVAVVRHEGEWRGYSDGKKAVAFFLLPIFGFGMGIYAILISVPFTAAVLVGHEVEQVFTVEGVSHYGSRKCRNGITVRNVPFPASTLCGFPAELKNSLGPGSRVRVSGRGTDFGLFAMEMHKIVWRP